MLDCNAELLVLCDANKEQCKRLSCCARHKSNFPRRSPNPIDHFYNNRIGKICQGYMSINILKIFLCFIVFFCV